MSTKSSQHPNSGRTPFQARHKVIVVTALILLVAAIAWTMRYTGFFAPAELQTPATSSDIR